MATSDTKTAIITASARGIGAAVAERLAKDGFAVIVNYPSDGASAEKLVRKTETAGGRALPVQADVSDAAAVSRVFQTAARDSFLPPAGSSPMVFRTFLSAIRLYLGWSGQGLFAFRGKLLP